MQKECPKCGRYHDTTIDGYLVPHRIHVRKRRVKACKGSGMLPKE